MVMLINEGEGTGAAIWPAGGKQRHAGGRGDIVATQ